MSFCWKSSGRIKPIKDHNSLRLFYSGVPLSKSLKFVLIVLRFWLRREFSFFSLWASSIIKTSKLIFWSCLRQMLTPSYEVIKTSKFYVETIFSKICSLCSCLAIKTSDFVSGSHFRSSFSQFETTLFGHTIKVFPLMFLYSYRKERRDIAWMVLPSPISSLKIQLKPVWYIDMSQLRPISW